jgi:hypothetical protein
LDLNNNKLEDVSIKIIDSLQNNFYLTELNIPRTKLTKDDILDMEKFLSKFFFIKIQKVTIKNKFLLTFLK